MMIFTASSLSSFFILTGGFFANTSTVSGWIIAPKQPVTKFAFLPGNIPEDILQGRQSADSTQQCEHHYFDPLTGEAMCWNHDYGAAASETIVLTKSLKPLRMEPDSQSSTDCGCGDDNYYFDPVTGEGACWPL